MANSIRVTSEGVEGASPTQLGADYVSVERNLYEALCQLASAVGVLEMSGSLLNTPLEIPLARVRRALLTG